MQSGIVGSRARRYNSDGRTSALANPRDPIQRSNRLMPLISKPAHARRYVESSATAQRLADIKVLLDAVRQMKISSTLKKRMLVHGIWEVARATGDFQSRYRSKRVIRTAGTRIQRDHIYKKSTLVEELLSPSPDIDRVIEQARCCIVTADEHQRLHDIDGDLDGWDRYRATGIIVYDMLDETRVV
jgi:hypothetical protein